MAPGSAVTQGQELARLLPPPSVPGELPQLEQARAEAAAAVDLAVRDRERAERLVTAGASPQKRLDEARAIEAQALARRRAAEAQIAQYNAARSGTGAGNASGLFILRSPIAGRSRRARRRPARMCPPAPRCSRSPMSRRFTSRDAFQKRRPRRRARTTAAEIEVPGREPVPIQGRATMLGKVLDPGTRTLPIVFAFDNRTLRLPLGQSVFLRLLMEETRRQTVIPVSAVIDDAGRPIVFVHTSGESFERRPVTLGVRAGGRRSGARRREARRTDRLEGRALWSGSRRCRHKCRRTAMCTSGVLPMIDRLIRWSLAHRPVVLALAVAFLVWGGWTATRIPLDVLPDLTAPTVTILVEAPGMDPLEIEPLVTLPIESALNGSVGVRRVRSATAVGVAVVWVEFDWGQDIARARQTVAEKLTLVAGSLPPGVEPPFLAPVSSIMGEVLFVDLESDRHSPIELRTTAETVVRRRLLAVPGVSQVIATGGEQKQYEVVLDPARLQARGVTIADVERALTARQQERDRRALRPPRARNIWFADSGGTRARPISRRRS